MKRPADQRSAGATQAIMKLVEKYAANWTRSKISYCSALIFLMRMCHRIRQ